MAQKRLFLPFDWGVAISKLCPNLRALEIRERCVGWEQYELDMVAVSFSGGSTQINDLNTAKANQFASLWDEELFSDWLYNWVVNYLPINQQWQTFFVLDNFRYRG